ncbi:VCBS repeat-containing protein [Streptomyces sp. NBC_00347]|nr:VCBS repeat-containing protein [Streptomyces sp. NBC_00347]
MVGLVAAVAVALVAPVAAAAGGSAAAVPNRPVARQAEEARALAAAAADGKPVELLSKRTEKLQTFANPDGSFTQDSYAVAQFVRQEGKLVPFDTRLQTNGDGSLSPRATEVKVRFSGGGTGPLVSVERDGRSMAWSWPKPLPKPVVDGDSVTYANVLPEVDLKLRAGTAGFGQLLIVHSAEAAAHPDLATVKFALSTNGLTVRTDSAGNMRATDPAGQEVFTAPTPLMWDSTPESAAAAFSSSLSTESGSNEFEPPASARDSAMAVKVSDGELALTPDLKVLRGAETTYPVYIDPAVEGAREAWAIVTSKYRTSSFYNGNGWLEGDGNSTTSYARVGDPGDTLSRAFFQMDTNNLWNTNKIISSSTFRIQNSYSYSCSSRTVELWRTGTISSSTTWEHQPSWMAHLASVNDSKGYSSSCPGGNLAFDVTAGARDALANRWNNLTLGLQAGSEGDAYAYKRFDARTALMTTTYNTAPNPPTSLDTVPSTLCQTAAPFGAIGNTDVYLTALVSDKDGGTVNAEFRLWGSNDTSAGGAIFDQTVAATSGTVARVKVPKATLVAKEAIAKGIFRWSVRVSDGSMWSSWTPGTPCGFIFDSARPSNPPGVSSTQFPNGSAGWPLNTGQIRSVGTFTFTTNGVGDVVRYEYWTDSDTTRRSVSPASPGGSATASFTPTVVGANRLYVASRDKADNSSDRQVYLFYANGLTVPDKPRDINGSGGADLWAISGSGVLTRHFGASDGSLTKATKSAATGNWTGAQITHYDDWTGDAFVDLIALQKDTTTGAQRLWLYENDGTGGVCAASCAAHPRFELSVYDSANNHWKGGVKQILTIGDIDGPLDTNGDGTPEVPGYPDLLVNDGTNLWLYYGAPDNRLDSTRDPLLLAGPNDPIAAGTATLNDVTLMAVGDFDSDGRNDLGVRFEPASIGKLFVYWGGDKNGAGMADPAHRGQYAAHLNWSIDAAPLITAAPAASSLGKIGYWVTTPNSGNLRFLTNFTQPTSAFTVAASDFTGYLRLS